MRDLKPLTWLHDVAPRDLKFAARRLRASSGVALATILTWTVGMTAMTTILGFVNAFMFRPMPVDNPDRIVSISTDGDSHLSLPHGLSFADLQDYRKDASAVADLVGYQPLTMTMTVGETAERLTAYVVTDNYFSVLGVRPVAGRLLHAAEGQARGDAPVVVLSHRYWETRFASNPSAVGRQVRLNDKQFTIVGVVPQEFERAHSFIQPMAYVPVWMADELTNAAPKDSMLLGRDRHQLFVLGRLKPGVSIDQARASLDVITRQLAQAYATDARAPLVIVPETHARPTPNVGHVLRNAGAAFIALALLLFALASTNVANLLIALALSYERDVAIKSALGARRFRLVMQILMDSVMLALLANIIAIPLSALALAGLERWLAGGAIGVVLRPDFSLDVPLIALTFLLALVAAIGAGLAPALYVTRPGNSSLQHYGRQATSGGGRSRRLRQGLLIAQVAMSFMLLVSGALFAKSLWNARQTDLGFEPQGLVLASASPRDAAYDPNRRLDFYARTLDRVKTLPGVEGAGWASWVPFSTSPSMQPAWLASTPPQPGKQPPRIAVANVTPDYLKTLGVQLGDGRGFDASDVRGAKNVGVINQTMAKRFWPNQNPLGHEVIVANTPIEVVGVVEDGKYLFIWESPQPVLFRPLAQDTPGRATLTIRVTRESAGQLLELQQALRTVDPLVGVDNIRTMSTYLDVQGSAFLPFKLGAAAATIIGVAGLLLASIGLYGLMASEVRRRKQDIGIRLALGAPASHALRHVLGQAARLALIGIAAGVAIAIAMGHLIQPLLLNVRAVDVLTYTTVGLLLLAICELASLLPALRATRISTAAVLRGE